MMVALIIVLQSHSYQVRRVDRATTDCTTPQDFDSYVKFCCSDIGQTITVELQVTDEFGLTSSCMAEAVVQFKGQGPSVICAPDPGVQACTDFESYDINSLTPPTVSSSNPCLQGALTPLLREVGRSLDDCGTGYIDVEWYYNITGEEDVICTNRVSFSNPDPFSVNDITWPADRTVESCNDASPTAVELENIIDINRPCSNAVVSEPEDRIFENVPNTCLRIIRTWTVVDWCRFPADPSARWTYEQTIDVINSSGPVIDISGFNLQLDVKPDSCRANMVIEGIGTDDCTPVDELEWTYRLDLVRNGIEIPLIPERPGRVLARRIDAGNYILTWTATDACGNTSLERQSFEVEDNLAPQAICGFAVRDISANSSVRILAEELNGGSTDNCNDDLTFAIRRQGVTSNPVSELSFTCSDIGSNQIELWVTDYMGNSSVCTAVVDIRDGEGACGFGASNIVISGAVKTPEDITVESAMIQLYSSNVMVDEEMTSIEGEYAFENITSEQSYSLISEKNDDYANGISTLDLVLMQRHILGIQEFNSPYKLIAADINNSHSISAVDIVLLRRLLLGHISEFPDNDSWKFISSDYEFADASNPYNIPEQIELENVASSLNQEIIAIKVGDLNSSAIANSGIASNRSVQSIDLISSARRNTHGDINYQLFLSQEVLTPGFQLGLTFDERLYSVKNVRSGQFEVVSEMISIKDGQIKISASYAHGRELTTSEPFLEITVESRTAQGPESIGNVFSLSSSFASELYDDADLSSSTLKIRQESTGFDFTIAQNRPNPFTNHSIIEFSIPEPGSVLFELFDSKGHRVYTYRNNYSSGVNQIEINRQEMRLNKGIYYYQINTQGRSLTRKMIVL